MVALVLVANVLILITASEPGLCRPWFLGAWAGLGGTVDTPVALDDVAGAAGEEDAG